MRFDIRYRTSFTYEGEVTDSQNQLRASPTGDDRQQVLHYEVHTDPSARIYSYTDYWGTRVDTFGVRAPHASLEVIAEATVETQPPRAVTASPRVDELDDPVFRDQHVEYLGPSAHVLWGSGTTETAAERCASAGNDLVERVLALHRFLGTTFTYTPGVTDVGSDVEEVLATRAGVCQDYAHVMIALARSCGIPTRYVSGYLFARDGEVGADPTDDTIEVQTHAWVEVALPGFGWWGLDPTNRQAIGERHVKIGHGRDYADVNPLRGVYTGGGEDRLEVSVEMRRMAVQQHQQQQQQ